MRSDKYLWNICLEIYERMYQESEPHLDFRQAIKSGLTSREGWFLDYYLDQDRQGEIIEEFLTKYKCNKWEKKKIRTTVWLGCSPKGYT